MVGCATRAFSACVPWVSPGEDADLEHRLGQPLEGDSRVHTLTLRHTLCSQQTARSAESGQFAGLICKIRFEICELSKNSRPGLEASSSNFCTRDSRIKHVES